jgi:hypothetical protein
MNGYAQIMGTSDWFKNPGDATTFTDAVFNYVIGATKREEAAERRHKELLDTLGGIVGAVAVGLRATADALERSVRRR